MLSNYKERPGECPPEIEIACACMYMNLSMHVRCIITFIVLIYNWRNVNDCIHAVSL